MITVCDVCHTYKPRSDCEVLHNISLEIPDSKFVMLLGQSGSGKTTLLNIIGGMMKPTSGEVFFNGESIYEKSLKELCKYRSENIGFIFQNFFLENAYTARENVMVPLLLNRELSKADRESRIKGILERVGLSDAINKRPTELSGGECQRVSIARALVNDPKLIIADEPTGNLDSVNGDSIINLLREQVENKKTVLLVTHNERYLSYADVVFRICDGVIE